MIDQSRNPCRWWGYLVGFAGFLLILAIALVPQIIWPPSYAPGDENAYDEIGTQDLYGP
jgi:hypothetical protein